MSSSRFNHPKNFPPAQDRFHPAIRLDRSRELFTIIASILMLATVAAILLPIILLFGLFAYYRVSELIYPGVTVDRTSLQGMDLEEAAVEMYKNWNIEQRILATDGLHSWQVTPADLGISLTAFETARAAYQVGRGYSLLAEIGQVVY